MLKKSNPWRRFFKGCRVQASFFVRFMNQAFKVSREQFFIWNHLQEVVIFPRDWLIFLETRQPLAFLRVTGLPSY